MTPADAHVAEASADQRRFGGVARLLGEQSLHRLQAAHVAVVGIGGVGSWAAEALARSGIGALTLIDLDHVAESNVNRQVHALDSTLGLHKGEAMARRIADISPHCRVHVVDEFVDDASVDRLLPPDALVIDAIDQPRAKAAMVASCVRRAQSLIVCGGAGAVSDGLSLARGDLARSRADPLLASVRARLRREHGFPRDPKAGFGVPALWFDARRIGTQAFDLQDGAPLACAGYGSIVTVTAAMGLAAAGVAIENLARDPRAARATTARGAR